MNMTFQSAFLWISTLLIFASSFRYIYSILQGRTKPNVVGWLLYQIATLCVLISSYELGSLSTIFASLAYAVNQLIIIILAFRYGYAKMERIEGVYFSISIFSLILWVVLVHTPLAESVLHLSDRSISLFVLVINTFIDLMGAVAIFTKLYKYPETEDSIAWGLAFLSGVCSILAIHQWSLEELVYPLYLVLSNLAIYLLCFRKKPKRRFAHFFDLLEKIVGRTWRE